METSERGKKKHFKNIETKDFFLAVNGINLGVHDLETSERGKLQILIQIAKNLISTENQSF